MRHPLCRLRLFPFEHAIEWSQITVRQDHAYNLKAGSSEWKVTQPLVRPEGLTV